MNREEESLIALDLKWERDRRGRELAGHDPDAEMPEAQPLSRSELRNMLRRDRTKQETKKS